MWDFRLEDEAVLFQQRRTGYAFIIDVLDGTPRLALYHVTRFGSKTEYFDKQPPQEMLVKALAEQGANTNQDGLYNINQELRVWAEENLL
jgi:hypothetical protein